MLPPAFLKLVRRLGGIGLALLGGWTWAHGPLHEQILQLDAELAQRPDAPDLLARRAELYRAHGLFSEARLDLTALEKLQPDNLTNRLRRGLLELAARETNSAVEQLSAWVQRRPASLEGHYGLAHAFVLAGRPGEAVPHFNRVIDLTAQEPAEEAVRQLGVRPELFLDRAKAQVAAGLAVTNTLAGLDDAVARLGPLPVLQRFAAELEMKRGDVGAAVTRLGTIAERAERKERWWFQQGELFLQGGRTNEARAKFIAARDALDRLPEKLQRAWLATELRQQIDSKLAAVGGAGQTPPQ
jgi:predicted Zn-dependent protease